MAANRRAIDKLLKDVRSILEVAEDRDINVVPADDPLRRQAKDLGIEADGPMTFGELRSAIEKKKANGCTDSD